MPFVKVCWCDVHRLAQPLCQCSRQRTELDTSCSPTGLQEHRCMHAVMPRRPHFKDLFTACRGHTILLVCRSLQQNHHTGQVSNKFSPQLSMCLLRQLRHSQTAIALPKPLVVGASLHALPVETRLLTNQLYYLPMHRPQDP